jgi:hypothetical protein
MPALDTIWQNRCFHVSALPASILTMSVSRRQAEGAASFKLTAALVPPLLHSLYTPVA